MEERRFQTENDGSNDDVADKGVSFYPLNEENEIHRGNFTCFSFHCRNLILN